MYLRKPSINAGALRRSQKSGRPRLTSGFIRTMRGERGFYFSGARTATPRGKVAGEVDVNDALLFHFEVRKATINSPELLLDALAGVSVVFPEVIHTLAELSRFEHDLLNGAGVP